MLPFFWMGFQDNINPGVMASLLIFILLLSFLGSSRSLIFFIGLFFIIGEALTNYFLVIGLFDLFFPEATYVVYFRHVFSFIACVLIAYGVLHFAQWYKASRSSSYVLSLPKFLTFSDHEKRIKKNFARKFLDFLKIIGILYICQNFILLLTILRTYWSQDYEVFVQYFWASQKGNRQEAFFYVGSYLCGVVLPYILIWFLILWIASKEELRKKLQKKASYIKIISSALFLSVGAGLLFWFLY